MKIKYSLFTILCLLACSSSIAQIEYIPPTAHRFSVSIGGGATDLFGDFQTGIIEYAGRLNADYNITPFLSAGIEGQYGYLSAKGYYIDPNNKTGKISVLSMYNAEDANVCLRIGQFLRHTTQTGFIRVIGGIYAGTGVGVINSNVTPTIIKNPEPKNQPLIGFQNTSSECFIPVNIGINIVLPKILGISNMILNINGQENLVLSAYTDGYHSPESRSNSIVYSFASAALKFNFGPIHY